MVVFSWKHLKIFCKEFECQKVYLGQRQSGINTP